MFESKVKEPALSEHTQGLIARSTGEVFGQKTDEIIRYKHKVMQLLLSNQDLLNCIHCSSLEKDGNASNGDAYRDVCVFDYMRLPDFKPDVRNYVCFDIAEAYGTTNIRRLTFRLVCHKDDIPTDYGVSRQDLMAAIIKDGFDWSNQLGLTLRKESDLAEIVGDYYYRELSYVSIVTNNTWNRVNGATRF